MRLSQGSWPLRIPIIVTYKDMPYIGVNSPRFTANTERKHYAKTIIRKRTIW